MRSASSIRGFTIVEMIVAVGLFAIVMLISVGALLMLLAADHKAQALQSVMNNLNISIDNVVRNVRQGYQFHCGSGVPYTNTADCTNGDTTFAFEPYGNGAGDPPWVVTYDSVNHSIDESQDGGITFTPITAPEVNITGLTFYVIGSARGSDPAPLNIPTQPKLIIVINGIAMSSNTKAQTPFHIQATAVQRLLDL